MGIIYFVYDIREDIKLMVGKSFLKNKESFWFIAFTLPEFLLTMTIIGIVASLTYTGLQRHVEEKKSAVAIQKIYNVLSQVTMYVISERDSSVNWDLEGYSFNASELAFMYYKPYFKTLRVCSNDPGCWRYPSWFLSGYPYLKETEFYNYMFTLVDGMNVIINVYPPEVVIRDFGVNVDRPTVVFLADINGDNPPNTIGKDIFAFVLREDAIVPSGVDDSYSCNVKSTGLTCTSRLINDNYKFTYY